MKEDFEKDEENKVFKDIENIRKHPIYIEAMIEFGKFLASVITTIAIIMCVIILIFLAAFIFLDDGAYDRCMERCVNEDQSNYSECSLSTCDFPI